jgi:hypothetical protein
MKILIKSSLIFSFLNSNFPKRLKKKKTKQFHEFILIKTDLDEITHNHDTNNSSGIVYSKMKILKVLTYQY